MSQPCWCGSKETDQRTHDLARSRRCAPIQCRTRARPCCVDGHPELVARGGADGAHLPGIAAFKEAHAVAQARSHRRRRRARRRGTIRWMRANWARITCCSASPMRTASGRRRRPCRAARLVGRAVRAALRRLRHVRSRRLATSPPAAPISCWSAISSGRDARGPKAALIEADAAIKKAFAAGAARRRASARHDARRASPFWPRCCWRRRRPRSSRSRPPATIPSPAPEKQKRQAASAEGKAEGRAAHDRQEERRPRRSRRLAEPDAAGNRDPRAGDRQFQRRSRVRRLSARPVHDRLRPRAARAPRPATPRP